MTGFRKLLVTGTDTGVGKTWICRLLLSRLGAEGHRVGAYKPVCSGAEITVDGRMFWQDVETLLAACSSSRSAATSSPRVAAGSSADLVDMVCPQRFRAPVAPPVAARMENRSVDSELLAQGIHSWDSRADVVIVEGAGGLMCPLSDDRTVADLAADLNCPLVIVAANRLGVINHTLLTVQVARTRGLQIHSLVLNDTLPSPMHDQTDADREFVCSDSADEDISPETNAGMLQHWIPKVPLFHCRYQGSHLTALNPAAERCSFP